MEDSARVARVNGGVFSSGRVIGAPFSVRKLPHATTPPTQALRFRPVQGLVRNRRPDPETLDNSAVLMQGCEPDHPI
jgi:hypothetical protein